MSTRNDDEAILHRLGYAQVLYREMSKFSNFAISFTIISLSWSCCFLLRPYRVTPTPIHSFRNVARPSYLSIVPPEQRSRASDTMGWSCQGGHDYSGTAE